MPSKKMEVVGVRHYFGGIPDHLRFPAGWSAKYLFYIVKSWGISPVRWM